MTVTRKPRSDAFAALRDLGEGRLVELENRMMKNESPLELARLIQDDWGELKGYKQDSVRKLLARYRTKHIDGNLAKFADRVASTSGAAVRRELAKQAERLNVMDEMENLVLIQKGRVEKLLKKEEDLPIPLNATQNEIRELGNLLKNLAGLQLETGHLRRVPKTFTGVLMNQTEGVELDALRTDVQKKGDLIEAVNRLQSLLGDEGEIYAEYEEVETVRQ